MNLPAIVALILGAVVFDTRTIPLSTPDAHVFLMRADTDTVADVFVLTGNVLTAYPNLGANAPLVAALTEGTSVFDVCDLNGDGHAEVVAINGDSVLQYSLQETPQPPRMLFQAKTLFSDAALAPAPHVLVVDNGKSLLLALPCEKALELRALDGSLIASYAMGRDTPHRVSYGSPFNAWTVYPPRIGNAQAVERRVSEFIDFEPEYGNDPPPVRLRSASRQRTSLTRAHDAGKGQSVEIYGDGAAKNGVSWPWFPLRTDGSTLERVLYAHAGSDFATTLLRIRESKSKRPDIREEDVVVGPERRYPGAIIVLEDDLPDFNCDGFADILLWRVPDPGISTSALTRTLVDRTWPIRLAVHLFSPQKRRFEPRPTAEIECLIPIAWFLTAGIEGPMRHAVLRDFDGDGRTDLGCSTGPNTYAVWFFGDGGFGGRPDFTVDFGNEISAVDFRADLDGQGCTGVGLRTANALHILHPVKQIGTSDR